MKRIGQETVMSEDTEVPDKILAVRYLIHLLPPCSAPTPKNHITVRAHVLYYLGC